MGTLTIGVLFDAIQKYQSLTSGKYFRNKIFKQCSRVGAGKNMLVNNNNFLEVKRTAKFCKNTHVKCRIARKLDLYREISDLGLFVPISSKVLGYEENE